jgi:hypothetical protein
MPRPTRREDTSDHTITWIAAGTAVGLVAGALVAERLSGRKISLRALFDRGRALLSRASTRWEPLVEAAVGVRDAWEGNGTDAEEPEAEEDEELDDDESDDESDDDDVDDDDVDDEFDDDLDEDLDDELEDEEEEDDDDEDEDEEEEEEFESAADDADSPALDARVLEAFANDPVLEDQDVEIEQVPGDTIVLHGQVRRAREVAHAVTIARGVPGVAAVRQRLRVKNRR